MTKTKCPTCGNRYHWHHAFAKFGYDDPATYLPANIQNLLNTKLPPERLFFCT
jgi:hypothetical protein